MPEIVIRTFQIRRDTKAEWIANNPVLASGELGYEMDTKRLKIGDGSTRWTYLSYFTGGIITEEGPVSGELAAHISSASPHPIYDDGPSLLLLYENAKV